MITPTRGAYAILAALPLLLYADRRVRSLMLLCLGCAVIPVATVVWIAAHGSLTNAFDDIILYPLSSYSSIQKVAFGAGGGVLNPTRLSYPLAFTLCVVSFLLQRRALLTRNFVTCLRARGGRPARLLSSAGSSPYHMYSAVGASACRAESRHY